MLADEDRGEAHSTDLPIVSDGVQDLIDSATTGEVEEADVWIRTDRLAWNPVVSVEHELRLAMLEGRIETRRDALLLRHDVIAAKSAAGQAAIESLLAWLEADGAEIVAWSGLTGTVRARLSTDRLADVVAHADVAGIDLHQEDVGSAGYPSGSEVDGTQINGVELENLLQSTQYYDAGYFGNADGYIGLTEGSSPTGGDSVFRSHLGFDNLAGSDRFENCSSVSGSTCGANPDPDPGGSHATGVASVMVGDITRGQDSSISAFPPSARIRRSGVARRAYGLGTSTHLTNTPAVMTDASRDIHVMNHSAGNAPVRCSGTSTFAQAWNGLFEDGVAVFMAAGNNGHSGGTCTLKDPGSALAVFTVGAYQIDSSNDEIIYTGQSRGRGVVPIGIPYADGRTLLDIQGPTVHEYSYASSSGASDPYPGAINATSGATPAVTGSAALFRDWFLDTWGTYIDAPGVLYANLLLMGDRSDESGGYLDTGFDELTGAGKLRLRMWDNLDSPALWSTGDECVTDGTTSTVNLGGIDLPSDVDMVKAVIWWYDHRHDSGVGHDKVDLTLQVYNATLGAWSTVRTSDTDDNKQRVYLSSPTTTKYRLRLSGRDVTSDLEGCGTDGTRVYWAWVFEDQDRDTGTDLDDQVRPEEE